MKLGKYVTKDIRGVAKPYILFRVKVFPGRQ